MEIDLLGNLGARRLAAGHAYIEGRELEQEEVVITANMHATEISCPVVTI